MALFSALDRNFMMLDYVCTHSQLLLRSPQNKEQDYNIDILFKPVETIIVPTSIQGLEISRETSGFRQNSLIHDFGFTVDKCYQIFRIKDRFGRRFFINAAIFAVFHNRQVTPCESGLKDGMGGFASAFGEKIYASEG